jgi:16S rRNA processing protein RimM
MTASEKYVPVGKISGVFGIKGWVKVYSYTDPRQNILNYSPIFISRKGEWVALEVLSGRIQGKGIVLGLKGINDPDQALTLIGSELAIYKEQLKPTGKNDYYWSQLIGLTVTNHHDEVMGQVDSLLETGAHDVLVVKDKTSNTERLIPFVLDDIVLDVDLDSQAIKVDWELDY